MPLPNCPYNCGTDYRVYDPRLGKMLPCPYCSKRVADAVDRNLDAETGETLSEQLGIPDVRYSWERIIPKVSREHLDKEKAEDTREAYEALLVTLGEPGKRLDRSYVFGLTEKGEIVNAAAPLLYAAARAGRSVAKLTTATEYNTMLLRNSLDELDELQNKDITVMVVDHGATKEAILAVKGLLEIRAIKGKPTILVSSSPMNALSTLCSFDGDTGYSTCEAHFLSYEGSGEPRNWYLRGIAGYTGEDIPGEEPAQRALRFEA